MRVISGVQPSGLLHLGNYFGAIREHIEWQDHAEGYFFIADLHALTTQHDGSKLRENTRQAVITYLACGLDPDKAALYKQSDVPEICEFNWILSTVTPMGILERAVSYKEARQKNLNCEAGLFNYPVLMAADILILRATLVPVGRDQFQHIEIVREVARKFNRLYAAKEPLLLVPDVRLSRTPFVPGTDGEKMSKRYNNAIGILDEGDVLERKVRAIITDAKPREEPKDPDSCTVFALLSLVLTEEERKRLADRYRSGQIDYREAKELLVARIESYFREIRKNYREFEESPARVDDILAAGALRARERAQEVLADIHSVVGVGKR